MKSYNGFEAKKETNGLPAGGYVACIVDAQEKPNFSGNGSHLAISFDIVEGEYSGYFKRKYDENTNPDKKWQGVFRANIPVEGTNNFEIANRAFGGMIYAFEASNDGYKWNWDEKSLVGKMVGVLFRNEEYEYNGENRWSCKPFKFIEASDVREGNFKMPKDKPMKPKQEAQTFAPKFTAVPSDEDLPF